MPPASGHALWHLLHSYAHALPPGPLSTEAAAHARAWLRAFDEAVEAASAGTCACTQHWAALCMARPPDLRSRETFYWWTVAIHDDVNARLGKPKYATQAP